jgi:hypothetical protein
MEVWAWVGKSRGSQNRDLRYGSLPLSWGIPPAAPAGAQVDTRASFPAVGFIMRFTPATPGRALQAQFVFTQAQAIITVRGDWALCSRKVFLTSRSSAVG